MHFVVGGSRLTYKGNNDYTADFRYVVRRLLCCEPRAFAGTVFKSLVFFRSGGAPIVATRRLQ